MLAKMKMKMGKLKVLMNNDKYSDAFRSLMVGIFGSIYLSFVPLNSTTVTLFFGIMICIFYLLHDLTISEGKRVLLDAERRESKRLREECNRLNSRLESDRTYNHDIIVELDQQRSKLKDKVKGLEKEVWTYKQDNECLNAELDHERSKIEELKDKVRTYKQDIVKLNVEVDHERSKNEELMGEVERSKVVMEDKDVLVNVLQGELGKYKHLEDVKEQELSVLKCKIAELMRLEKKLKELEADKEELLKTVGRLEGRQCEYYSNQVLGRHIIEKIESLRDLFNQQVVIETQGIAKSLFQDQEFVFKPQLEKADNDDTRSNDDDEGYEVVCDV